MNREARIDDYNGMINPHHSWMAALGGHLPFRIQDVRGLKTAF
jgi:hypothetical protein